MNLSEPQLISPLLDGFVMGNPINNRHGVRTCPAMHLETDKKYIVKILSLPANQSKLDALLLAGAYTDRDSALEYFKDLADSVVDEAALLQKLSKHEGFVSFENWQMLPMEEDETGFDIYLLSEYRPTLEGALRNNEMTHLQAINMGLDLCAALSVSRRFGYLYADLRPSNIYICNEREFRIGDLGFMNLDSLPYASLPDKYHSDYTPPEISDAYSALNSTMDTYAVGMILYQAYNDGKLPPVGMPLGAPRYADLALTEIILKACAVNPDERWHTPAEMGQALASYLQSNTVNDTPITPPAAKEVAEIEEVSAEEDTEPTTEDILAEVDQALESAPPIIPAATAEGSGDATEAEAECEVASEAEASESVSDEITEHEQCPEAAVDPEVTSEEADTTEESTQEQTIPGDEEPEPADEKSTSDEIPGEVNPQDETAQMLAQADDLIAHQLPEPPVAPEPIEVTLPVEEDAPAEESDAQIESDEEIQEECSEPEENSEETETAEWQTEKSECADSLEDAPQKKRRRNFMTVVIVLAAILIIATAGILFYQQYYLQTIHNIVLSGTEDRLSVTLTTDTPDEKLSVKCTDTHGNSLTAPVQDGVASFVGLKSGTTYKLEVRIDGFHKLLGKITETYITATQTTIDGFYAATGPEDGSVILSFTHQGPDSTQWNVHYSAEGEEPKTITFNGHMVTITGLTIDKEYAFNLEPVTELYLNGTTTITHIASRIIYAEKLEILGFTDNQLAVTWIAPENVTIPNWYIRCYNDTGYDKSLTTSETIAYFEDLDITSAYTIEVTAEGMTIGTRAYLTANSVTIRNLQTDPSDRNNLKVSWEYEGTVPSNEWLLLYTVDGGEQQVVQCTGTSGTITPLIPGAHYTITVQPTIGVTLFGGTLEFDAPEAPGFTGYLVSAENISFSMCITPNVDNWDRYDVPAKNYTTSFPVGTSASFVMQLDRDTNKSEENVVALYVIRNSDNKIVSSKYESRTWNSMWYNRNGKLTIPFMPELPGSYTVAVYFNGTCATTQNFEVLAG